jgi:hypothetical protein
MHVTPSALAAHAAAKDAALQPLAGGLQQLTELHIGTLDARQLQHLPQKLQRLHLSVSMHGVPEELLQLAVWVEQHGSTLSSLELVDVLNHDRIYAFNHTHWEADWEAPLHALGEAFAAAAAAHAAAAEAAHSKGLQLQSLSMGCEGCVAALPLLQHLPAHSLTSLDSGLGLQRHNLAAQLTAVCSFTALRSLHILGSPDSDRAVGELGTSALVPLTELQQLTHQWLPAVSMGQLAQLQLPGLKRLNVVVNSSATEQQLQISHLTGLDRLQVVDLGSHAGLAVDDQLPPFLQQLYWASGAATAQSSVQLLLRLTRLQQLSLKLGQKPPAAAELVQLSSISSLQRVGLSYKSTPREAVAEHAQIAWPLLPLVQLGLSADCELEMPAWLLHNASALQGLRTLTLKGGCINARPSELAAVLRHMPALQHLKLVEHNCPVSSWCNKASACCMGMATELLQAIGSLQQLRSVRVWLAVELSVADVQHL